MGEGDKMSKKTHYDNLWQMVRYCENIQDCRRQQQLQYFGEVFDTSKCGEMRNTRCDNCSLMENSSIEMVDITDTAKMIVKAVQRLVTSGKWNQRNFTLNHLVDIWRGSKAAKIVNSGWDKDGLYGKGTQHTALEANRIMKKLILDGYLWEELVVTKDCGACAYVKPGPKTSSLISGQAGRIFHSKQVKKSSQEKAEVVETSDPRLLDIQEGCLEELKQGVLATARGMNPTTSNVHEVIPLQCLRDISLHLPTTAAALGRLEHMTGHRMNNYQDIILTITREYHSKKLDHLASSHHQEEQEDFTPSSQMDSGGWMGKGNSNKGRGANTGGKSAYFNKKSWGWKGQGGGGKKRKESAARGNSPKRRSTGSSSTAASSSGSARPSVGSMGLPKHRF